MSGTEQHVGGAAVAVASPATDPAVAAMNDRPGVTRRLTPSIGFQSLVLFAAVNGTLTVLLPAQLAALDEAQKVQNLALVNVVAVVFSILSQPLIGSFSDRTRSGLGRRTPWMVAGAILTLGSLFIVGQVQSIGLVMIFWVLSQIGINAVQGPLTAIIPDRYPLARRGVPSALLGFGTLLGAVSGVLLAGRFATDPATGYLVFGAALVVATAVFVVLNRDRAHSAATEAMTVRGLAATYWVSPRKYPDFALAFAARFVFYLGFWAVSAVNLFILTDYVGLPLAEAGVQIGVNTVASLPGMVLAVIISGILSDRLGRRKVFIYLGSAFVAAGFIVPLTSATVGGVLIGQILIGIGFGLYLSTDTALMTMVLPDADSAAAKDLGILNIATVVPQAGGSVITALILGMFGGYEAVYVFAIAMTLFGALLIIPIKSAR